MQSTLELLQKAQQVHTKAEWARILKINPTTWTRADAEGKLPAAVAGALAIELGEDPKNWVALAAIEAMQAKNPAAAKRLKKACHFS